MSIKSLLMPPISQWLLSRDRLLARRARAERNRRRLGQPHRVHYFHQLDDPYSLLAAASLQKLRARYDVEVVPHLVGPPSEAAAPEREKLVAYSRRDAQMLSRRHGLGFVDPGSQPTANAVALAQARSVVAIDEGRFVDDAVALTASLWSVAESATASNASTRAATAAEVAAHLAQSEALRGKLGHYLGAMFHYEGEWYWGVDRLHHLEARLQAVGAARAGTEGLLYAPGEDLRVACPAEHAPAIDFFLSLRSPYSAIVTPRVFELGRLTGAPVRIRYVLPMAMRGLPVPLAKRTYISLDAAREAHVRNIPFGRVNDPLGRPTERGLALLPLAEREGKAPDYLSSFMKGVWAEGIDAGSDRGLRRIAERAGLDWTSARQALTEDGWRAIAEHNRAEMFSLGLWGVPSFRVGDCSVWGQDRLWAVQEAVLAKRKRLSGGQSLSNGRESA